MGSWVMGRGRVTQRATFRSDAGHYVPGVAVAVNATAELLGLKQARSHRMPRRVQWLGHNGWDGGLLRLTKGVSRLTSRVTCLQSV